MTLEPVQAVLDRILPEFPLVRVYKPDGHLLTKWKSVNGGDGDGSYYVKLSSTGVAPGRRFYMRGAWLDFPGDTPQALEDFEKDVRAACVELTTLAERNEEDDDA